MPALSLPADGRWRERAACVGRDPEIFFPAAEAGPAHDAQVAAAKAVCHPCPVRAACLAEAMERIPFGIAGGLTPEERRARHRTQAVPMTARRPRRNAHHHAREDAGLALLARGRPLREIAARCAVTERTVARWAARARAATSVTEGSAGGHRAPLLTSPTHDAPAKDTTAERTRA